MRISKSFRPARDERSETIVPAALRRRAAYALVEEGLRPGPQCFICRAWRQPCPRCQQRREAPPAEAGLYIRRATSLAKYVKIKSAPARRMEVSDSNIARSRSIHPSRAAA